MLCPSLFQILTFGSLLGQSLAQLPDVLYRGDTRPRDNHSKDL